MEKQNTRRYERKAVYLESRIILETNTYFGVIKNISEYGANAETISTNTITDFVPGTILQLEIKIPSGDMVKIPCEIAWLYTKRNFPYGLTCNLGMEIFYPPIKYSEFLKAIH